MASTFEDSVLDFDINFFQQTSNNAVAPASKDKVRKAIFISKRKMMSTDSLIRKFYDKRLCCRLLERSLLTSKEEYKQACIESMEYREKCAALEEEIKKLQSSTMELEEKCVSADNRYDGMQSHAKQLQLLVKENETEIESLKIEQKLEKANFKEQEKKFTSLQRENEHLIKNICSLRELVLGKKKITKELKLFLTKYGSSDAGDVCDSGEHSCDEADSFHTPMSPLSDSGVCNEGLVLTTTTGLQNEIGDKLKDVHINEEDSHTRDDNDHDSECSNEVVSLDTGRGSSLAFSDSDKCFNSPEYFSGHSPLSTEIIRNKDKVCVDIATSPIPITRFTNIATSPVKFENAERLEEIEEKITSHSITNCSCEDNNANSCIPTIMIDRVVSPIIATRSVETSTSPVKNLTKSVAVATSPLKTVVTTSDCSSKDEYHNIEEMECLELNNSNCLEEENSSDGEIQMILNTMRFSQKLITPIPTTPGKSRIAQVTSNCATQTILHNSACPDAAKIREENITLQATVAKLANDISNINNFLHKLNPLINNDALLDTGGTSFILNDGITEAKETITKRDQNIHILAKKKQTPEKMASGIEKLDFKDKKSKLKRINNLLFADSSPPSPCSDFLPLLPQREPALSLSPTLAASPPSQLSSPPPTSHPSPSAAPPPTAPPSPGPAPPPTSPLSSGTAPPSVSPPPSLAPSPSASLLPPDLPSSLAAPPPSVSPQPPAPLLSGENDNGSFNDETEDNNNVKSKERLQFEESLSNQGILSDDALSDNDLYEHKIVIELGPDCLESDTNSLHEILKEQVSKEKQTPEETNIKRTPKFKRVTKLEKLRKKMLPKSKIKKVDIQTKRIRRIQPKRLSCQETSKSDNFINNKAAYEKACKVMAEIKSKEKVDSKKVFISRLPLRPIKNAQKTLKCTDISTVSNYTQEKTPLKHNQSGIHNKLNETHIEKSPPPSIKNTISKAVCSVENEISNKCQNVQDIPKTHNLTPFNSLKRTVRTDSLSESNSIDHSKHNTSSPIQNLEEKDLGCHITEVTSSDKLLTPPPQSPSHTRPTPKMYGRNRNKNKGEDNVTNINNTGINDFVKPHLTTIKEDIKENSDAEGRKRLKRPSVDKPDLAPKRMLRSSTARHSESEVSNHDSETLTENGQRPTDVNKKVLSYEDLDIFNESPVKERQKSEPETKTVNFDILRRAEHPKFGILCAFLDKYGGKSTKTHGPKLSENAVNAVCKKIEDDISEIQKLPPKDTKQAMDKLVQDLRSWKQLQLLSGLMKYLKDPARKIELFNKLNVPPAPPMTKTEQILIYLVSQLKSCWPDIVDNILKNIEYSLFMLNRTPEFDAIETLSHFYAVLCRYDKNRNRLRLFIIDAMYCLQYKAVPLIRQCLDVWMHILPLAHMGIAKNPLVTCLVYLLHFYKCEDKFNRVQEIRNILNRKYFYEMSEWNETRILEMFRNSIIDLRDIAGEKKMLRMALIVLAKRHGARWCQNHIVKNMLQPIIEQAGLPDRVKLFCVSLLGPLLKPYPIEMKVNCEIVMNQLFDMLNKNPSKEMEEAIFTSLIYMSRHNQNRVIRALLFWKPGNVSLEFEDLLKNYVKERPIKSWKTVLSKVSLQHT